MIIGSFFLYCFSEVDSYFLVSLPVGLAHPTPCKLSFFVFFCKKTTNQIDHVTWHASHTYFFFVRYCWRDPD